MVDDDLFDRLKADVRADWKAQAAWRAQAEDDFAFVSGHQWTETERSEMESNQRLPVVFNRVAPIIASVAGFEINNRTQVRFIPREIGDAQPNEVLSAGAKWFRDQADAEDAESTAFRDVLVCGLGFTETSMDFEADPEGAPRIERIPVTEMCWDSHAYRKALSDATRFARVREIPTRAAKEMFPGVPTEDLHAAWIDVDRDEGRANVNVPFDQYTADNASTPDAEPETVTLVQCQWRERRRYVEYVDPQNGQRAEMTTAEWDKLGKAGFPVAMIPHRKAQRYQWMQAFLGNIMLGDVTEPCPKHSTFQAITGHWDVRKKEWHGLLRMMRDPQKFANKWLSTTMHIMGANAKGGVVLEEDAVSDIREFEESWSAADAVTYVKPGRLGSLTEKPKADFPAAFMNLTEFSISSIRDVSGVNLEILGMREANQPGILEYQRRQSAMVTLSQYFDALRFYRKRQGDVILHFLREYVAPTGRLVRLVKEDQAQYVPLAVETDTHTYDVIVDDAPTSTNEKEKAWAVISELMPLLMQAGLGAEDWADILEYSPLPASFAEKVRAKASQAQQQPDPAQQAQMQMMMAELQKVQAEIERLRSQAMLDQAKAQQIGAEAQAAPMKAQAEVMKAQSDMVKVQADTSIAQQDATVRALQGLSAARRNEAQSIATLRPPTPTGA